MSGTISFSYIPPNLRVPLFYTEFDNTQAGISQPVQRRLIIGQCITAAPSVPTFIQDVAAAQSLFGINSQLANMIAAFRANDPIGELWAVPFADAASSAAASGTVAFSGTATAAGTIFLYVGGTLVQVGVNVGDTAATVATNAAAAVNAVVALPVTGSPSSGTLTLTADNKGTLGNGIPILLNYLGPQGGQILPAGITASITAMAGGATDPSLTSIATILGDMPFDYIVNPYSATLAITSATMSDQAGRWSYSAAIYGHVFSAPADTVANLITFGTGLNDQHLSVLGVNAASPTPAWIWAAALVGAIAPALDADPARPVQTLPIAGVLPAPSGSNWNFSNRQSLLTAGIAVAQRDAAGTVSVVRCVTTYQTNKFGQPDQSYLDVEIMTTLTAVVRALKAVVTQKFPRAKLADDGTRFGAGQPVVTPSIARGVVIAEYANLVDQGLCENETAFAAGLIVQRNANDNSRLDVLFDPYLVSGLRIFAVLTQFHLAAAA